MKKSISGLHLWQRMRAVSGLGQNGYSIAELMVVVAVIGILVASSAPFFVSYYQSAKVKAAAEDLAGYINQARQLAIRTNNNVCVQITATNLQFRQGGCAGTVWIGAGTDSLGNIKAPEGVTLAVTANPVFSYLGAATPAATYTVTNTDTGLSLHVILSASGRITIGP
jgi:prepilin-type N-terminal cleavage/methylation domain-containing protein